MRIIFCSEPLHPSRPDEAYAHEVAAAESAGLGYELISYEALVQEQDAQRAVRRVCASAAGETAAYRGWMLSPARYKQLYDSLAQRGLWLISSPEAYALCHYLPATYPLIGAATPQTVWLPATGSFDASRIMEALRPFDDRPLIVKDYVKSQKHHWREACYIPCASDSASVMAVVNRFLDLQGDDLAGGLVFREYIALEPLAHRSKSGMPLGREFRRFVLDGKPLLTVEYWEEGAYGGAYPPEELFADLARTVQSRFYTMDVARTLAGVWMIIELGDGQVAGLPERTDVAAFYHALATAIDRQTA